MPIWVVATIGIQVLVSTVSLASSTSVDPIERTRIARISGPVAQVISKLVEHREIRVPRRVIDRGEVHIPRSLGAPAAPVPCGVDLPWWHLDLPPPGRA